MKEIIVKVIRESPIDYCVDHPKEVFNYWNHNIKTNPIFDENKEFVIVLCLDSKNNVICHNIVTMGTVNSSLIHAREVFKPAIASSAISVILCHNHPGNKTKPSPEDIRATNEIHKAGEIIGIHLIDHVIITEKDWYSFRNEGIILG